MTDRCSVLLYGVRVGSNRINSFSPVKVDAGLSTSGRRGGAPVSVPELADSSAVIVNEQSRPANDALRATHRRRPSPSAFTMMI
jgi:hypothetical protein